MSCCLHSADIRYLVQKQYCLQAILILTQASLTPAVNTPSGYWHTVLGKFKQHCLQASLYPHMPAYQPARS
eukprot:8583612-Pyramimonas_sp.AAC.1